MNTNADSPAMPVESNLSQVLSLDQMECASELNLLIIDDDLFTCRVINEALAHRDFHIETVTDPAAVEQTLRLAPTQHLIILDFVLPGLPTEQVLGMIHRYQPEAAIIIITGYPTVEGAQTALRARVFDYLTKPFELAELRRSVVRCLESRGLLRMTVEAVREALGAAIRERRKAQGLTLAEMVKRTGVSLGYLSQIELGRNSASIETLYKISLALGVRLHELFQTLHRN